MSENIRQDILDLLRYRPGMKIEQIVDALASDTDVDIYPTVAGALGQMLDADIVWTARGNWYIA